MHEQLPSQSFDNINPHFSSLTVWKCILVDGDLFSDSDTDYSNPDTLRISDLSNVSVEDNSDFDSDADSLYIEGSNSDVLFSEHSDASSETNGDFDHPNDSSLNTNFSPLSLFLINLQSVGNKKETFWEMLGNYSPEIVIGCETCL